MFTSNFHLPGSLAPLRALWRPVIVRRYLRTAQRPSLHIGCGGNVHAGWLNTDLYNSEADTYLDATKRFPFEDQTFERVFSEHLIEHLPVLGRHANVAPEPVIGAERQYHRCKLDCFGASTEDH